MLHSSSFLPATIQGGQQNIKALYQSLGHELMYRAEQSWPGIRKRCEEIIGLPLKQVQWIPEPQGEHPLLRAVGPQGQVVIEFHKLIDDNPSEYQVWASGKAGGTHAPVGQSSHG